jgi:hypothetical protein
VEGGRVAVVVADVAEAVVAAVATGAEIVATAVTAGSRVLVQAAFSSLVLNQNFLK